MSKHTDKMREEYERIIGKPYPSGSDFRTDYEIGFYDAWQASAAQSAAERAELKEANRELREALEKLLDHVETYLGFGDVAGKEKEIQEAARAAIAKHSKGE